MRCNSRTLKTESVPCGQLSLARRSSTQKRVFSRSKCLFTPFSGHPLGLRIHYAPVGSNKRLRTMYIFARAKRILTKFVFFDNPLYRTFLNPNMFFTSPNTCSTLNRVRESSQFLALSSSLSFLFFVPRLWVLSTAPGASDSISPVFPM